MIDRIEINNFATIEHLSFDLGAGFNVITGETGAGKSILLGALSLAQGGGRAYGRLLRRTSGTAFTAIIGKDVLAEETIQDLAAWVERAADRWLAE